MRFLTKKRSSNLGFLLMTLQYGHGHSPTVSIKEFPSQKAHLQSLPKVAPLLGECAIIDKETGRVYWQGGEQSLFDAIVGHTYLKNKAGVARHVRATTYSCILWISVIKYLARRVLTDINTHSNLLDGVLSNERIWRVVRYATNILRFFLVCLTCLPKFHRSFLLAILIFYFIESYTCSTRKYLSNVLLPENIESYLDLIKEQKPCVKWDLRCFHYEKRKVLSALLLADTWKAIYSFLKKDGDNEAKTLSENNRSPSILSRKIVTHKATQYYKFNSWEDDTVSGMSKQNEAGTTINSDFTKISMCKLVLFANPKSRADYFIQQSNFVNEEGRKDVYAELSTKVEVEGFKKRLLVVKRSNGILRNLFSLQYYWLCTCLLLTVPYRVKFSKHCDEVHITLAKETSIEVNKNLETHGRNSWFLSTKSWFAGIGLSMTRSPGSVELNLQYNATSLNNETETLNNETETLNPPSEEDENNGNEQIDIKDLSSKLEAAVEIPTGNALDSSIGDTHEEQDLNKNK